MNRPTTVSLSVKKVSFLFFFYRKKTTHHPLHHPRLGNCLITTFRNKKSWGKSERKLWSWILKIIEPSDHSQGPSNLQPERTTPFKWQVSLLDWELGISRCKLLYIEWINNRFLLYSTGNYIPHPVINHNGKEYEKECIYMHNWITLLYSRN